MKKFLFLLLAGPLMVFAACTGVIWQPAYGLFNVSGQNAVLPNVAIDPNGNAVAAWLNTPSTSGTTFVQVSYLIAGGTWSAPINLSGTTTSVAVATPAVAIDKNGNAVVAWYQFGPGPNSVYNVRAKIRPAGVTDTWVTVTTPISPATSNAGEVVVAWDNNSNAVIGWSIFGGAFQALTSNIAGAVTTIINVSGLTENTSSSSMVANGNGDIIATWINTTGSGGRQVEASIKPNGSAWPTTPLVVSPSSDIPLLPSVAMDNNRNAVILWSTANGSSSEIVRSSQKFGNASSWNTAITITSNAYSPSLAQVGMDNGGNITAAWSENPVAPANNQVLTVSTKTLAGTAWTTPVAISNETHEAEGCISLGVDSGNDAVVIWSYDAIGSYQGAIATKSRPVCSSGTWLEPEETLSSGINPSSCSLSINATGSAVSVWATTSGTTGNSVVQISTGAFNVSSPTSASTVQYINDFALVSEYYDLVTWSPSLSPGVSGYNIYQNGSLIATVGSNVTEYENHNQVGGQTSTYTVTASNSAGLESEPISAN